MLPMFSTDSSKEQLFYNAEFHTLRRNVSTEAKVEIYSHVCNAPVAASAGDFPHVSFPSSGQFDLVVEADKA